MKIKKSLLLAIGGISVSAAAIVPAVTLSSCSSGYSYVEPLAAKTITATSLTDAKTQLNNYFKNNSSISRLNSDLEAAPYANPYIMFEGRSSQKAEMKITASSDGNNTVKINSYNSLSYTIGNKTLYSNIESEITNIPVIPVLKVIPGTGVSATQNTIYEARWCLVGCELFGGNFGNNGITVTEVLNTNITAQNEQKLFKTKADCENAVKALNPAAGSFVQYTWKKASYNIPEGNQDLVTAELKDKTYEGWKANIVSFDASSLLVINGGAGNIPATSMNVTVSIPVQQPVPPTGIAAKNLRKNY